MYIYSQKYLHESRHKHAMQRCRGDGGRFFTTKQEPNDEEYEIKSEQGVSQTYF